MDAKTSKRIFELARDQQDELEVPDDPDDIDTPEPMEGVTTPRFINTLDDDEENDENDYEDTPDVEEEFVR